MNNIKWFKVFIICLVVITLGFLSWQLIAQIETINTVKTFLQGSPSCPNLVVMDGTVIPNAAEVVDLTMKDTCTGLVWMRRPLPNDRSSAAAEDDVPPGYTWAMAKSDCEAIKLSTDGPSLFRLPTVEELMSLVKIQCPNNIPSNTNNNCTILSDYFPADITVTDRTFATGYFWAINDFNEAPSWKTDNAGRDYKRSVNLLTGQADSPVFGKDVRLNAWCIVDRQPEIIERKFTSVSSQILNDGIQDTGVQVTGGSLQTVYNRKCIVPATDDCSSKWTGASCDATSGYCSKTETIDLAAQDNLVAVCNSGYHVEGSICVLNTAEQNCGNSRIDNTPTEEACDDGVFYNGKTGQCNSTCSGCVDANFHLADNKCVPNCGDGNVNSSEVCDKLNDYRCNNNCTGCIQTNDILINGVCTAPVVVVNNNINTNTNTNPTPTCNDSDCAIGQKCINGACSACPTEGTVTKYLIANSTSQELTDYQIKISNKNLTKTGGVVDEILNITDERCNYIPYYTDVVSETDTEATADIWVKIPSISANGNRTILVSTGKPDSWWPDAPYTFDLFEDFQEAQVCASGTNSGVDCVTNTDCPGSTCVNQWATAGNWDIMGKKGTSTDTALWDISTFNNPIDGNCKALVGSEYTVNNTLINGVGIIQGKTDGICDNKKFTYLGFLTATKTFDINFRVLSKFFITPPSDMDDLNNFKALFGLRSEVLSLKSQRLDNVFTTRFARWDGTAWVDLVTPLTTFPRNTFTSEQRQIEAIYSSGKLQLKINNIQYVDQVITDNYNDKLYFAFSPDKAGIDLFRATFNNIMVTKYVIPEPTVTQQ